MKKFRKKGSVIIEYLVVLPIFMMMLWAITQLILYSISSSTAHEAAMYGAEIVATEMRGTEQKLSELSPAARSDIIQKFHDKASRIIQFNRFLLLYNEEGGERLSDQAIASMTLIEDEEGCLNAIKDAERRRVICIYTKGLGSSPTNVERDHEQIIVKVKMPFQLIGEFIPGIEDRMVVHASGTQAKEISGRYQPYYRN